MKSIIKILLDNIVVYAGGESRAPFGEGSQNVHLSIKGEENVGIHVPREGFLNEKEFFQNCFKTS